MLFELAMRLLVKVTGIDKQGRVNLSRKAVLTEQKKNNDNLRNKINRMNGKSFWITP